MKFAPQQNEALEAIERWKQSDRQVFYLGGYAGTGKTTLAQHIGADMFAAYTGKAAHIMNEKGCKGASTIHSLIYVHHAKSRKIILDLEVKLKTATDPMIIDDLTRRIQAEGARLKQPAFSLNEDSDLRGAKLLVIDECSMINEKVALDLESFDTKILVLGDPAQLPPVFGEGHYTGRKPDFLLTDVHRQAKESPILDLATTVRTTGELPHSHECMVQGLTPEMALGADQLIVGRNVTRRNSNRRLRELLGRSDPFPEAGDKIVCTRNNHELGLMNGALFVVEEAYSEDDVTYLTLDSGHEVAAHTKLFLGQEVDHWEILDQECFEYGYALTCHKSQGSQWNKVGILNESNCFRQHAARWLYTAITRAEKELWIV